MARAAARRIASVSQDELEDVREPVRRGDRVPKSEVRRWLTRVDDRFMGTPMDIDPYDALLLAIRYSRGEVAYCDEQIRKLQEDELFERPNRTTYARMPSGKLHAIEERRDAEALSRWVQYRDGALDRMAKYSKMAIDAGIDERRVKAAEQVADMLIPLFRTLAEDLNLTHEQRELLPQALAMRLRALETIETTGRTLTGG